MNKNSRLLGICISIAGFLLIAQCGGRSMSRSSGSEFVRPEWSRNLTSTEQAVANRHGLVLGPASAPSFHLGYTALFKAHKPAYFTADAILHAVHRSFDLVLMEIERSVLQHELRVLLKELRSNVTKLKDGGSGDYASQVYSDVDLYLAVAESLLTGEQAIPLEGADSKRLAVLLEAAKSASGNFTVDLFGEKMLVDLSMLKPRGHYANDIELRRYFSAMMWLGRIEIRIATPTSDGSWQLNRRALEASMLIDAAFSARAKEAWQAIDQVSAALVGPPDSMSFPGLRSVLSARGDSVVAVRALSDASIVDAFKPEAAQKIGTQMLHPGVTPIAFLPLGQRYLFDSHVLSAVSYGQLPVKRMMPSPLDVAHAVFRNPAATEILQPEFERYTYKEALDAITTRGDEMGPELWDTNVAHLWLQALRELSPNEKRDASLPAVMKTPQWHRRILNTQLASWAELRHDVLLYAKQSVSAMAICGFPKAYVEPYPSFFAKIIALTDRSLTLVKGLNFDKNKEAQQQMLTYYDGVRDTMLKLQAIAETERKGLPMSESQLDFLNHAVSVDGRSAGCTVVYEPKGWYARLYFRQSGAMYDQPIVADVHTQPTDASGNMVGKVLHVATGAPRLMEVTIETPEGPQPYRGFVSSYYEHITTDFERLTDREWSVRLQQEPPPDVPWLKDIAPSR